ncbi:MAG TPA: hypothetical protein VHY32_08675 [Caulobacteraceae bacterium]|jgi:hypothetical protein|nr:hypothetical protein [Caulobacteraceae bacterium]
MLEVVDCLERAAEAERHAAAMSTDEIHALCVKSAVSWRALAALMQLAEEASTTESD